MNIYEFAVLEGLNGAGTRHIISPPKGSGLKERLEFNGHQATAAQISDELGIGPRMAPLPWLNPRSVGGYLRGMNEGPPRRREPLVERVGTRRWRLSDAGVKALSA